MGAFDFALPAKAGLFNSRVSAELHKAAVNTLWITMRKDPAQAVHNFSLPLLAELREMVLAVKANAGNWNHMGQIEPVHYAVMRSDHPEYFNLGGDLSHFRKCINARDRDALYDYSKQCLDIMYDWATVSNAAMTTIALVQGRALGGGFEAALSADFLIAEEHSTFGFPEIMFGLFPCTGGMSLLSRRVGVHQAERMMTSKRIYSAPELLEMGVIDEICPTGGGIHAVERFIATHATRRKARMMLQRSRHRLAPLDYQELSTVVDEWVETAMQLTPEELRAMDMLIMMQKGPQQVAARLAA
jgi:DSF synthase